MSDEASYNSEHRGPLKKRRKKTVPPEERDCEDLYCLAATLKCALSKCVCCAYKVCLHSSAEHRLPPNGRPESCLRVKARPPEATAEGAQLYANLNTLCVGDGDLSFSLALARVGVAVDCTTLAADVEALKAMYVGLDVDAHIGELEGLASARLAFGVDATALAETVPAAWGRAYDRIVFNFPCVAVEDGLDGQSPGSKVSDDEALATNRALVTAFARSARSLLKPGGEVHITHKASPPFSWWKIADCVRETNDEQGATTVLEPRGALVFDRASMPPYANRKAKHKQGFPAHDALTYVFLHGREEDPHHEPPTTTATATATTTTTTTTTPKATLPTTRASTRRADESGATPYAARTDAPLDDDAVAKLTDALLVKLTPAILRRVRAAFAKAPPTTTVTATAT